MDGIVQIVKALIVYRKPFHITQNKTEGRYFPISHLTIDHNTNLIMRLFNDDGENVATLAIGLAKMASALRISS